MRARGLIIVEPCTECIQEQRGRLGASRQHVARNQSPREPPLMADAVSEPSPSHAILPEGNALVCELECLDGRDLSLC